MKEITEKLFLLKDNKYQEFQAKLVPNINSNSIIGVRVPDLRCYAKELVKDPNHKEFLKELPHSFYEENLLHGFILSLYKDYDECIDEIEKFIPYMDNWAVTDTTSPKSFKKNKNDLIERVKKWISSTKPYTIRFGISILMSQFLDDDFKDEYLILPLDVKNDDYYVKMMVSWYYATALAKKWDNTIYVIENNLLPVWTHNKTIQKAIESFRVEEEHKEYLKTLRRK